MVGQHFGHYRSEEQLGTRRVTKGGALLRVNLNGDAQVLHRTTRWFDRPLPTPDGRYLAFADVTG